MKFAQNTTRGDIETRNVAAASDVPEPSVGRRRGPLAKLDRQMLRFAMVGVVNSVFGFGVFAGLQIGIGSHIHYLLVLVIAHVISVLEAYVLQRQFVFRVRGRWWRDLARFWSVYLVALAINAPALSLLVEVVHMAVLPAQAIIMLLTATGTFFAHRGFSFRRPAGPTDEAGRPEAENDPGPRAVVSPPEWQDNGQSCPDAQRDSGRSSESSSAFGDSSKSEGIAT